MTPWHRPSPFGRQRSIPAPAQPLAALPSHRPPCETRPGLVDKTVCRASYGAVGSDGAEWEKRGIGPFLSVDGAIQYAFADGADWLRIDDLAGTMLAVFCPEFDGNWE